MTIAQSLSFLQNSQGALTTGTINVASGPITLSIANSQKVAVDSNGYLLVGYPSSIGAYSLQVAGNGYFAGNLNITGQVLVNGVALGPGGSGTGGNPSTSTQVQFTNNTQSTGTASGALTINGGLGVGGSVFIGGTLNVGGFPISGSSTNVAISDTPPPGAVTGTLWWDSSVGNLSVYYNDGNSYQWVDAVSALTFPNNVSWLNVTSSTVSTSTLTGGLIVTGGVGIGGTANITSATLGYNQGRLAIINQQNATVSVNALTSTATTVTSAGFVTYAGAVFANTTTVQIQPSLTGGANTSTASVIVLGGMYVSNTASSISTLTGAFVVAGGVGVGGDLRVGGTVYANTLSVQITTITAATVVVGEVFTITNATQSVGTNSGALVVIGGVGIGGNLNVGGSIQFPGQATPFSGSNSSVIISDTAPTGAINSGTLWWDSSVGTLAIYYNDGNSYQWVDAVSGLTFPNNVGWLNVTSSTVSTGTTTGALQVLGGVGIGGTLSANSGSILNLTVGYTGSAGAATTGTLRLANTTTAQGLVSPNPLSTSTYSGAMISFGGIVIANTANVFVQPGIGGYPTTATGAMISSGGIYIANTTNSTSTLTGALVVAGGIAVGADVRIQGTLYANTLSVQITTITAATVVVGEVFTITNATQSITTQTGALVVTGGLGVGGNLNVGGFITFPYGNFANTSSVVLISDTAPGTTLTGTLWWDSSVGNLSILYNDGNSTQWVDAVSGLTFPNNVSWLNVTSATVSTSTLTGGLIVTGGVGIGGTANITSATVGYSQGRMLVINQQPAVASINTMSSTATTVTSAGFVTYGGAIFANTTTVQIQPSLTGGANTSTASVIVLGGMYVANTAQATSTLTGAVVIAGGLGIGGDVRIGGTLFANTLSVQITTITAATVVVGEVFTITNTTPSVNTVTGALVVTGGVGVGGSLNVGGSVTFANGASFAGTSSVVIIGDTPPTAPITGTLWWDSAVGSLSIYYNDGNSTQWVDAVSALTFPNNVSWLNITSATVSTSTLTGGLIVTGGVGIGGTANITSATVGYNQGRIALINQLPATAVVNTLSSTATTVTSAAFLTYGGAVFANTQTVQLQLGLSGSATTSTASVIILGGMYVANTASSTSTVTGAVVIGGGVGIGGAVYIGSTLTSTSTLTGALVVSGGVGVGGDLRIQGTLYASTLSVAITTITQATVVIGEVFTLTNSTQAGSTNSGAMVVVGGVGIGNNLIVGGNITATSVTFPNGLIYQGSSTVVYIGDTPPAALITGTLWWDSSIGTLAIYYNDGNSTQWVDAVSGLTFPNNVSWLNVTSATNSTSTLTGGLIVTGGVGIGQTLFATSATIGTGSGRLNLTQSIPAIGNISQVWTNISTYSGAMVSYGGISIANTAAAFISPGLGGYPTTASGALIVAGGAYFANTSTATSTVTGAVVIAGGLGVGGNIAWGGLEVTANVNYITVSSTAAYGLGTSTTYNVLLVTTGGLTATLTFPTAPVDGQHLVFSVHTNNVTLALTAGPTLSGTFAGSVTAPTTFRYVYRSSNTTWYRIQ